MAPQYVNFQNLTLVAAIEVLLVLRLLPDQAPAQRPVLWTAVYVLTLNYTVLLLYRALIYPTFLSPLRHLPQVKFAVARLAFSRFVTVAPPGEIFAQWSKSTPNDGIIRLRGPLGGDLLLLTKPPPIADVLVHHPYDFSKPSRVSDVLREILGDGLVVIEGEQHKFLRKHTLPAFTFRRIKQLYPIMWSKSLLFTQEIKAELTEHPAKEIRDIVGTVEINKWAGKVTMDVIGIAGLGRDFNVLRSSEDQMVKDYEALLEPNRDTTLFFQLAGLFSLKVIRWIPWKVNKMFLERTASIQAISKQLVRNKRELIEKNGDDHFDILSVLIRSNVLSDSELADQLLTFLAAGHDTTTLSFTWACYLLAVNQEMQEKLRREIRSFLPSNQPLEPGVDLGELLERLPYLNAVINETLRLYPTVPITSRVAHCDTEIMGYPISKGKRVILSPWAVNRSPALWGPDAEAFRPERWIDDGKANNHGGAASNYSLLTFLHGPRSCIGQSFAKAELRCLVAATVGAFKWTLGMDPKDIILGGAVTLRPEKGLYIKLEALSPS